MALLYRAGSDGPLWVAAAQHALGVALIGWAGWLSWRWGGRWAGVAAAWCLALHGPFILYENLLVAEVLGAVLLAVAIGAIGANPAPLSAKRAAVAGCAFGLNALVRPSGLAVALVVGAVTWAGRRLTARTAVVLGVACLIPLIPVTWRNYRVSGDWLLVTASGGFNAYVGNHAEADGTFVLPAGVAAVPGEAGDPTGRTLAERELGRSLSAGEVSDYWLREAVEAWRADPVRGLRLFGRKMALVWNRFEVPQIVDWQAVRHAAPLLGRWWLSGAWVLPLAALGLIAGRWRPPGRVTAVASAVSFTVVTALVFVTGRYRVQIVPLLAVAAGLGLVRCLAPWTSAGQRAPRSRAATAGLVALVVVATSPAVLGLESGKRWIPPMNQALRLAALGQDSLQVLGAFDAALAAGGEGDALVWVNRGNYRLKLRQPVAARRDFQRAVELDPQSPQAWVGLAGAARRLAAWQDAEEASGRAVALAPRLPTAWFERGLVAHARGDAAAARVALRAAIEHGGGADAWAALGTIVAAEERWDEARRAFGAAVRLEPEVAPHQYNLGLATARLGEPGALEAFAQAVALDSSYVVARLSLAAAALQEGDRRLADEQLRWLTRRIPGDPRVGALRALMEGGPR